MWFLLARVTDKSGNPTTCNFTAHVLDITSPTLTCPSYTISTDVNVSTANYSYPVPIATDNVQALPPLCNTSAPYVFTFGTASISCLDSDLSGNMNTCVFTVSVVDRQLPTLTCPAAITRVTDNGTSTTAISFVANAWDNVAVSSVHCSKPSPSVFAFGSTTVACTAYDTSLLRADCTFLVSVADNQPPVLTGCPSTIVLTAQTGTATATATWNIAAADNVAVAASGVVCDHTSGALYSLGNTTVGCTALDTSGNAAACAFNIMVLDREAPVLTCPQLVPIALPANANVSVVNYVLLVSDNAGSVSVVGQTCAPASGSLFGLGATLVNCSATDLS